MTAIAENLSVVRKRIEEACLRCGRNPSDVRLVGVTKTVPVERIREGVLAGITILGENYIQEARKKIELLSDMKVSWHFIGHLQSNKAAVAAECFDWVETVDRESLARELNRQVQKRGKRLSVLLQVNVGEEESKSGVSPGGLPDLFRAVSQYDGLIVR